MSHRREQKERLRIEREKREAEARAAQQRKKLVGYGAGAVIALLAVVVVVLLATGGSDSGAQGEGGGDVFPSGGEISEQSEFDLQASADAAGCELESVKGNGVLSHTGDLDVKVNYKQNPPNHGRHFDIPAEDGIYFDAPQDEQLVHSLEHGRVIIWVKPNLPLEEREQIRALYDEDSYQLLVVPRRDMPYDVAATAWNGDPRPGGTGRSLTCEQWQDGVIDALRSFRDEHRSNGPEDVP